MLVKDASLLGCLGCGMPALGWLRLLLLLWDPQELL